jgi:SAM-dependent methyltransferase
VLDQVGPDGSVTGVDQSPQMLAVAKHRSEGFKNVAFEEGDATALPVESGRVDRALSVQVLEYVADAPIALAEMHRALRPGRRGDLGRRPGHGLVALRGPSVWRGFCRPGRASRGPVPPRTLAASLRMAGFEHVRMDGHAFATTELGQETYGVAALPVI